MKYIKVEIGFEETITDDDVKKLKYLAQCLHEENKGKTGYKNCDILVSLGNLEDDEPVKDFVFAIFDCCPREQMPDVIIGDGNNITNLIFGPGRSV